VRPEARAKRPSDNPHPGHPATPNAPQHAHPLPPPPTHTRTRTRTRTRTHSTRTAHAQRDAPHDALDVAFKQLARVCVAHADHLGEVYEREPLRLVDQQVELVEVAVHEP
jgi:hypothetical protein